MKSSACNHYIGFFKTKVKSADLTELNDVMAVIVAYVFKLVGANKTPKEKKKPWWKRLLEKRLEQLNCNLGFVKTLLEKKNIKRKHKDRF